MKDPIDMPPIDDYAAKLERAFEDEFLLQQGRTRADLPQLPEPERLALLSAAAAYASARLAEVEARVRANLEAFLHPITGGSHGKGWGFGESVYLSQIAQVVEAETEGVDYAAQLRMTVNGIMFEDVVPVGDDMLVASGAHEIRITLAGG